MNKNLYLHLISGFDSKSADQDYLIEIDYNGYRKFITLCKNVMLTEFVGAYKKGKRFKLYYQGVEVFNEFLGLDFNEFLIKNKYISKNDKVVEDRTKVHISFIEGARLEIIDEYPYERLFDVEFVDKKTNQVLYNTKIKNGWWCAANQKYFVDWKIIVKSDNFYKEYF